ncbi:hypothetical protein [Metabacillus elymi]|uniref:Uncharacterized protein n=1 Tax=Metabacillus elymi TaxID=2745198 RepID=A0ABX6S3H4_9BACI|nr:hypothetical protein [Metabacillus sp. KUDC1714]QNF28645.1 hypothetical protein HUW50_14895 [Metabacillus sp. KUDC1714]
MLPYFYQFRETVNKINDSSLSNVLVDSKERMLDFYQETCDVVPQVRSSREVK